MNESKTISLGMTEELLAASPAAAQVIKALEAFFLDTNAGQALRKALICQVEERLDSLNPDGSDHPRPSGDAADGHVSPLDPWIVDALVRMGKLPNAPRARGQASLGRMIGRFLSALRWCMISLGGLLFRSLPAGVAWRTTGPDTHYTIALTNKSGPGDWGVLRSDVFMVDGRRIRRENILVILMKGYCDMGNTEGKYRSRGIPTMEFDSLRMPIRHLFRELLPRYLRLNLALLRVPARSELDRHLKELALRVARAGRPWEAFIQQYKVDWFFDDEEYTSTHVVRTLVLNRYGARTLRIPHSVADAPGRQLAYLHYNVFASCSNFARNQYGHTWSSVTHSTPVGLLFNDALSHPDLLPDSPRTKSLLERLRSERCRVILLLTGSFGPSGKDARLKILLKLVRVALEALEGRTDRALLVKPKGFAWRDLKRPPLGPLFCAPWYEDRVFILSPDEGYGADDSYSLPLQFFLPYATVCLVVGGSALYESWGAGCPAFALAESFLPKTPLSEKLKGIATFEDVTDLRDAVEKVLDGKRWCPPGLSEVLDLADPFRDGRAVERLREIVLRRPSVPLTARDERMMDRGFQVRKCLEMPS